MRRLVRQLQLAHAGELAAARAYRGHARSVRDRDERASIVRIEADEWGHRRRVNLMLAALGAAPSPLRERIMGVVGRLIGMLCYVSGWFLPMYGAGWIERRNVHEYLDAAEFAREAGRPELVPPLLAMAEVEWDHEHFFRTKAMAHWLCRLIPVWAALPPREKLAGIVR
ncbi:MAG TPA: ferritin-like domain-containing protein [Polyangiaceae bacterium]